MKKISLILILIITTASNLFAIDSTEVVDSIFYIKEVNYFSNVKGKEKFYDHFVRISKGTKYTKHDSYMSLRRLQELKQFSFVKLVEEFEKDSVVLNFYITK